MKEIRKNTAQIDYLAKYTIALRGLDFKGSWYKPTPIADVLFFLKEKSRVESELFAQVDKDFPTKYEKKAISVGDTHVEWNSPEEEPLPIIDEVN